MARLAKVWPVVASAVLLTLAFPPFNLGLLVFVALVPLLRLLKREDVKGFRAGYWFGALFMLAQFHWLPVLVYRWTGNVVLAAIPTVLAPLVAGLYFGLAGWLIQLCYRRQIDWAVPLVWAGVEVFRSFIPVFAFPYGLIANPLWPYPWIIQLGALGTIYLVGAWVMLSNVLVARLMDGETKWSANRGLIGALFVGLVLSGFRYVSYSPHKTIPVTIGQPGIDFAFGDPAESEAAIAEAVARFSSTARSSGSKLLILPEGIAGGSGSFPPNPPFEVSPDVPILFGGRRGSEPMYQTAFAFDGKWHYADKTRLVIFGEYVPGRNWIPFLSAFELPAGDMVPGDKITMLEVNGMKVGPVICFESLFADVAIGQAANGAELLAVMSIDDWYMGTGAPDQLRAGTVWRSVETGLSSVRAASLGYSFATDGLGRVITEAPLREQVAFRVEVPVASSPIPPRLLWLFPIASVLSLLAVPIYARVRR